MSCSPERYGDLIYGALFANTSHTELRGERQIKSYHPISRLGASPG